MKPKKKVPPEVSAYMSKIGKNGWKAKLKKLSSKAKVGKTNSTTQNGNSTIA